MTVGLRKGTIAGYGMISDVTYLCAIVAALTMYFLLRNNLLMAKIKHITARSFIAGTISYVIIGIAAGFVVAIAARHLDNRVAQELRSQMNGISGEVKQLRAEEEALWNKVNLQATTTNEIQENISVLAEITKVDDRRAVIFTDFVQGLSSLVDSYSHEYPAMTNRLNVVAKLVTGLKEKGPPLHAANATMIQNLSACYSASLRQRVAPSGCVQTFESDQANVAKLAAEFAAEFSQLQQGSLRK